MTETSSWSTMMHQYLENTPLRDSHLLGLFSNALYGPAIRSIEKEFKLGRDEANIMLTLAAYGACSASDICQMNARPKNSISRAVNKLFQLGIISREPVECDLRKETLALTTEGQMMYRKILPAFADRQKELLANLEYEERRMLESLMKKALLSNTDWRRD
jgi:DNA-binding MarR family transcriptional regulator